ncbi:MAG: competence type IV pilus minor pilin ComGF [Bacillota bacterium]|uniref:ComGF family competence protein n=1 Tax=Virgibacillus salarius TaxID=447199 RepID=A0A941E2R2_9BACI|nr:MULTISPECIES: ComGF family competence protein [Bacillaceae]MBR7797798.1 ComGF family competence protein [Virgibacillus salarius]MDY7046112.1 ComGF family competence protein [Virgibacillus sp. M23]NAZ10508.1 hypothetical protein [Agaribacter marinus]WBX79152.1 ComGF family competence protein [Virgibacillus salarius]
MPKKGKRSFVYTDSQHKQSGFSFITTLIMVTILVISLPFLSYLLKSISNQSDIHELSIQQFFQHLRNEVMQATDFRIVANKLLLESNGATVSFELYQELIRRQVNGLGHEIYVRGVKDFSLAPLSYGFQIIITSTEGDTFEKDIILYE